MIFVFCTLNVQNINNLLTYIHDIRLRKISSVLWHQIEATKEHMKDVAVQGYNNVSRSYESLGDKKCSQTHKYLTEDAAPCRTAPENHFPILRML